MLPESKPPVSSSAPAPAVRGGGILTEDVELRGTLYFERSMEFNARFDGQIHAQGPLTLGAASVVKGTIRAHAAVTIMGKILGDIEASGAVELKSGAVVNGNVTASTLVIQSGAVFNGQSTCTQPAPVAADFDKLFTKLS